MTIVQIGCYDGRDDVYQFISENKNKINKLILIEPLKIKMAELRETYKDFPFAEFYEMAIVSKEIDSSTIEMFAPKEDGRKQVTSINRSHALPFSNGELESFFVPCKTIQKLFDDLDLKIIDRLYIDTEGFDCKIVASIDFSKVDIKYIEYEHVHSDGLHVFGSLGLKTRDLLKSLGYRLHNHPPFNTVATL